MRRRQFLLAAAAMLASDTSRLAVAQAPKPAAPAAPPPAPAPSLPNTPDAYRIVFDGWVAEHRPDTAILVVRRNGRTVAVHGHKVDANAPTLIGSMSKAITAVA